MQGSLRRLLEAVAVVLALVLVGAIGFHALGAGRWSFDECIYMTVITLSTVGFEELDQMREVPGARPLTIALIATGVGALTYVQGNLTALLVEGTLGQAWRRKRMLKQIAALGQHVVVAGAGSTGRHVLEELIATQTAFVVIDRDHHHLERLSHDLTGGKMLFVHGDATEDSILLAAGVDRAQGVVAALTHDKDNLFVTLSARSLNPVARIVAKVTEVDATPKMLKAGATAVVNPALIGGRRMASELIRPEVTEFLDQMLRDKERTLRLEEVTIPVESSFVGTMLKDTPFRRETKVLVVAVRDSDRAFKYNPDPEFVLGPKTTLVVLGDAPNVLKLREMIQQSVRRRTFL